MCKIFLKLLSNVKREKFLLLFCFHCHCSWVLCVHQHHFCPAPALCCACVCVAFCIVCEPCTVLCMHRVLCALFCVCSYMRCVEQCVNHVVSCVCFVLCVVRAALHHLWARIIRWAGKKTLLVCCEERARRSRLSSNQTFGDLGLGKKGGKQRWPDPINHLGNARLLVTVDNKQQLKVAISQTVEQNFQLGKGCNYMKRPSNRFIFRTSSTLSLRPCSPTSRPSPTPGSTSRLPSGNTSRSTRKE